MRVERRDTTEGFTLLEAMASVVMLGLFIGSLVLVTTQAVTQAKLNAQKQAASMIGRDVIAKLAVNGIGSLSTPQQITANGVIYTVMITTKASHISPGLTDVTANVSWNTEMNDSHTTLNITVEQVLSQ
jgi:Tfp pilus assembly protein PilV